MKFDQEQMELDAIDLQIVGLLQEHCKLPLAKIGERVGLSAPAVIERIKKLEENKVITGYAALVDARKLGCDISAFIGVVTSTPGGIRGVEAQIAHRPEVLECHHVTGSYTLLLKVKTADTSTLEQLISHLRAVEGVARTETMVVLSTHTERQFVVHPELAVRRKPRRSVTKLLEPAAKSAG